MKWLAAFVSCALVCTPVLASEITPAEQRDIPYNANLPGCEDPFVLQNISTRFAIKEDRFWNTALSILSFETVRQIAWRPWGLDLIPRRFCSGTVTTSDGHRRRINYSIREDLGFLGATWGTEWCVEGLDHNYAYAPQCKQALP